MYKKIPDFHIIFVFLYVLFNFIGLYQFDFYIGTIIPEVSYIFITGLLGFLVGMFVGRVLTQLSEVKKATNIKIPARVGLRLKLLLYVFFLIIAIAAAYENRRGIILMHTEDRFANSAIVSFLTILFSVIVYYYYSYVNISKKRDTLIGGVIFIYILIELTYGYRSSVITTCLTLFFIRTIFWFKVGNNILTLRFILKLTGVALLVVMFAILIEYIRLTQQYNYIGFFKNVDIDKSNFFVLAFLPFISMARYDQEILVRLYNYVQTHDYFYSSLLFSNISTLLPGDQLAARNIVGQITTDRVVESTGKAWSITSTIQGNLFLDGGYLVVFFGFFVVSLYMYYLKVKLSKNVCMKNIVFYAFFSVVFLESIHTGYFDASIYLMVLFMFAMDLFLKLRIKYE